MLYNNGEIDAWNNINALITIINSTLVLPNNKPTPQTPTVHVVACANAQSNVAHIKDFLKLHDSCIGIFPKGDGFEKNDQRIAASAFIKGNFHIPEFFKNKFKTTKKQKDHKRSNPHKLTPRQKQVFDLIVNRGASNKSIARILQISESTVKLHMTAILKKNSVRNRTQLAVFSKNLPNGNS
jgi:DNA-binding NarL/FixJ family response regulator